MASPPLFEIASANSCNLSSRRAPNTTFAPYDANNFAVASPIPEEAPVIIITLSLIAIILSLPFSYNSKRIRLYKFE